MGFLDLTDEQLLELYHTDKEYSILLEDGTILFTDDDPEDDVLNKTKYCICHSDFEVYFELQEELKKRFLISSEGTKGVGLDK